MNTEDQNHIFFKESILEKAEPLSFRLLKNGYAQDKNHVFYQGKVLTKNDDFKLLDQGYASNKQTIFFEGQPTTANSDTFEIINDIRAKDDKYMYLQGKKITEIPAKYFVYMTPQYVKAPNGVYYITKN